jgi:hypothetical protein
MLEGMTIPIRNAFGSNMALLFRGKSVCRLCGNVIGTGDKVVAFPPFLESSHPLARYSDAAFHRHCFDATAERTEVLQLLEARKKKWPSGPLTLGEYEARLKQP